MSKDVHWNLIYKSKNYDQPKCPQIESPLNKLRYIPTMRCYVNIVYTVSWHDCIFPWYIIKYIYLCGENKD